MATGELEIYIDGAAAGNPGDAGIGVAFVSGGEIVYTLSKYLGATTNNTAEYLALIYALQEALKKEYKNVKVSSDSQLLVRQINGEYKVKNENLKLLYSLAINLIEGFEGFAIFHIPREKNKEADKLAKNAVKENRSSDRFASQGQFDF